MAEETRQGVMTDAWLEHDLAKRTRVVEDLRCIAAQGRGEFQVAADTLEALGDQEVLRLTREVVEAYAALHECVVYQTRGSFCVTTDVQHALTRLEHLGIISAAGSVSDEVADREEAAVVRTLSKALDRHKAHGSAGLAEMAAEQIADLKRQLRSYDRTQHMLDKLIDKWKAHAQKRKRELKQLRKRLEVGNAEIEKQAARSAAFRFWLGELVAAVENHQASPRTPMQVVSHLEKQFPGWRD